GEAVERSGDTSSSVLVQNINVEGLYVGQGVTGSGIPAGTKIAEIIDTPPTASYDVYPPVITAGQRAIKLTKAATTTVIGGTLTFAAGTGLPVAECPADEYAGWSKEKAILLR
ncbi:hypothetical protein, partial [Prosthecobacter sp.]|uniref:hypothetical protein n=1 Tax=Prosthecobacter sp. TaxID=1965333 RepID=UPI003784EE98